jgi:long-chain acyl-CoA synthetase
MMRSDPYVTVPTISTIQDMVLGSARAHAGKIALEDMAATPIAHLSYSSLLDHVLRFGAALRALGIPERTHVAILSENRVQWALAYLTVQCFNMVAVPVDRALPENEILNILFESDSECLIFSDAYAPMVRERRAGLAKITTFIGMDLAGDDDGFRSMTALIAGAVPCPVAELPRVAEDATASIVFTSGSLGRAKGVELTQGNLAADLMGMCKMVPLYTSDRFLSVLPIHHTYECTCGVLCPLYMGCSVHFARSLRTVVDDLQRSKATILLGVPLLYNKMFKAIWKAIRENRVKSAVVPPLMRVSSLLTRVGWKNAKRTIFHEIHARFGGSIRIFIAGGAAPDPLVAKGLREFGFHFLQGYGLTETSPILTLNRYRQFKDDAAGLPLPGVELHIHEPDADGIGEIWAKGRNIMKGYYKNEELTREAFSGGWFRTGDLGYIDGDGFLHISGRHKNVIISAGGKNVFPEEIEDILSRSPFIQECYVYGQKDAKQGEIIAAQIYADAEAFIELAAASGEQITEDVVRRIIAEEVEKTNQQLKPHKRIRTFSLRDQEFQKTTSQKIKRHLVRTE